MKVGVITSKASHTVESVGNAGETIKVGSVVCLKASDNKVYNLVDGIKDTHSIIGVACRDGNPKKANVNYDEWTADSQLPIIKFGTVLMKKVAAETLGSKIYYKSSTGELTSTASGNIRVIGISVNKIKGDSSMIEVAVGRTFTYQ